MTSLERPLPLPIVVVVLAAMCVVGFTLGLRGALKNSLGASAASTQPLAEVSGVPVQEATPFVVPPPAPEVVKPKPPEPEPEVAAEPEAPPVIEAPPATPPEKVEAPPAPTPPRSIEDLY